MAGTDEEDFDDDYSVQFESSDSPYSTLRRATFSRITNWLNKSPHQNVSTDSGFTSILQRQDSEEQREESDQGTPKRKFIIVLLRSIIVVLSFTVVGSSVYILSSSGDVYDMRKLPSLAKETIRLPCGTLEPFFPVAAFHHEWDKETSQEFLNAGIERHRVNGSHTDCQMSVATLLSKMSKNDLDAVEAQLLLVTGEKGPPLSYSAYNLTISNPEVRHIVVDGASIVITTSGFYFLYYGIQLSYGPVHNRPMCRDLSFKTSVSHLLRYREQDGKPGYRALIGSSHTCCESCEVERSTDFTGGLFYLAKKDKLFIQVSAPDIIGQKGENFFGIFMASEMPKPNITTEVSPQSKLK